MVRVLGMLALAFVWPYAADVRAHGIWFAERSGALAMIYGHGAEDLDMIKRYDKVRILSGFDAAQAPVAVQKIKTDRLLIVDTQHSPAVVAGVLDNGYWSKGADGKWINKGRDEVPGATESGRYIKYAIHLRSSPAKPLQPLKDHVLQILPVRAKLPEHMNEAMTLRVLFNGAPAVGAKVTRDYVNEPDGKPLIVGKDGMVTLKVRNQGLNVITAAYDGPAADPAKAQKTGLFASLSFVIKHAPD